MQLQVVNSPFNQEQVDLLNRLLPSLTGSQQVWLSGYLTASSNVYSSLISEDSVQAVSAVTATLGATSSALESRDVTVLFGSQTGNCQRLAKAVSLKLEEQGYQVALSSMSNFKANTLKQVQNLLILVSTHGEGDAPDNALPFYEFLHSKRAPQLNNLKFSVLALGDTSYEFYCQTGKDLDKRLEELGGNRFTPRVDCDVDYDDDAAQWIENVLAGLHTNAGVGHVDTQSLTASEVAREATAYSRTQPFPAEVLDNVNLNGRGSDRETRHLELSLEGSNFQYEPGDCVGIYPENNAELADALINHMRWQPDLLVPINKKGDVRLLRDALLHHVEITVLTKPLLEQVISFTSNHELKELLEPGNEDKLRTYLSERDLLDLVQDFGPWQASATEFVSILRKLPYRLYSIASSSKANPDEVHLTIRTVRYEVNGRDRYGVCSTQCAERLEPGDSLPIFIHENPNFKLPTDPQIPIIMIGPGTGVAPFRAFIEEREAAGSQGKNWLFYGDQHFVTDFLYQLDFQRWVKDGVLTHMDVAFSRDSDKKVYVQHRMLEKSQELYQWIEQGASVYVCGDEKYMAHDVHNTLLQIIEQEGGKSSDEAIAYVAKMQQEMRYQRDVY
ncbi:assimilatory sulfite reductase (NADPH) flavoprotein subunit [Paenibacillus sp. CMAA1364]